VQDPVQIVPMRVRAINGRSVSSILADTLSKGKEGDRIEGWAVRREYRSTYRDSSVSSEKLVVGDWWTGPATGNVVPVSLEVGLAGSLGVTVRDTIVWDVQGVPITSVVTSLREVNWARFEPNFFAVFPSGPLNDAPQSLVLMTRVDDPLVTGRLQRLTVERFPNVTSVDLTTIQQTIERIVSSVVLAIRFMALFSLATGVVVLIGALATSRFQRVREAALLKTVGATRRQVVLIMVVEYAALGFLAALVAMLLATAAGWALSKWIFEIPFQTPWQGFALLGMLMVIITIATGLWSSLDVFRRPPLEVLRAE
jgi:putative ABC transport system permease protein